jgi:tripartite-type tricarboxylate transporter receptor subunit TctC
MVYARCRLFLSVALICLGSLAAPSAMAQSAAEFYAAKPTMRLIVSSTPGGGYDLFGRLVARYMTHYLPGNPQIVVQNMPGGGGITAANYLYNIAPKDGSMFGLIDRGIPTAELLYGPDSKSQFDIKQFNWLGSISKEIGVGVIATRAAAQTVDEFRKKEVVFGSNGLETDSAMYARLFNSLLGTKLMIVVGYPGQTEYLLAMSRGETDGLFMSGWSGPNRATVLREFQAGQARFFAQMTTKPNPDFGNTPTIMDLVKDPKDQEIVKILLSRLDLGRPFLAPPGVAADRIAALREAFKKTAQDREMISEAVQSGNSVDPIFGDEAQAMILGLLATPPETVARMQAIVRIPK